MKSPVILRIFKGDKLLEVKQLSLAQIVFGHDAEVHVDLDDDSVAPIHALIEERDNGYYLCDLGSITGTFRNGVPVLDELLESGDQIQIGVFQIVFYVGIPKPKAAPPKAVEPPPPPPVKKEADVYEEQRKAEPKAEEQKLIKEFPTRKKPLVIIEEKKEEPEVETEPMRVQAKEVKPPPSQPAPILKKETAKIPELVTETPSQEKIEIKTPVKIRVEEPPVKEVEQEVTEVGKKKVERFIIQPKTPPTYAPRSDVRDLGDVLRPGKGPVVEVIVSWNERALNTYHFVAGKGTVSIGRNLSADIVVPSLLHDSVSLLKISSEVLVYVFPDAQGEVVRPDKNVPLAEIIRQKNPVRGANGFAIGLRQGEMLRMRLPGTNLFVFIRYVHETPKPALVPPVEFSAAEVTGIIVAMVLIGLMALYMHVYVPAELGPEKQEEQMRVAKMIFNAPKPSPTPMPTPEPTPMIAATATPTPTPQKIKVAEETKKIEKKEVPQKAPKVQEAPKGKPAEVANVPQEKSKPKKFTSVKEGGSVKTGSEGAGMASEKRDVTKVGLLSAFGGGGSRTSLDKAYSGSGELMGLAQQATGKSGLGDGHEGNDVGTKLKATGQAGQGTATMGIAGIGTKGRSSGLSAYGSGGFGDKERATVSSGGIEEEFVGSIDKEAVRRVVKAGLREVKSCYEKVLNQKPDLIGKVVVAWQIGEQGRVLQAWVKQTTLNDKQVEDCVVNRLKIWKFPEPPAGTYAEVSYPFVFASQK